MKRSRIKHYLKYLLLAIVTLAAAWLSWRTYVYFNPRPLVNFQYYEPTKVVDGLHLTSTKRLDNWTPSPWLWFAPYGMDMLVGLSRHDSWIEEVKGSVLTADSYSCGKTVVNTKCFTKSTAKGQSYLLINGYTYEDPNATPLSYTRLSGETVEFVKNGTLIDVDVSATSQTPIPDQAWSDMIDSFAPAKLDGFKVYRMHPGP